MKPLELINYRRVQPGEDGFWEYRARLIAGRSKRLTDADLAAEYHASMASANFALSEGLPWVEEMARHNTICRFATHPHYDEADQ